MEQSLNFRVRRCTHDRCHVVGCPNGQSHTPYSCNSGILPVTYHRLPLDEPRRTQWLEAVPVLEIDGQIPVSAKVCSQHFRASDYGRDMNLTQSFGLAYKFPRLSRTAVPSVIVRSEREVIMPRHEPDEEGLGKVHGATSGIKPADSPSIQRSSRGVGSDKAVQVVLRGRNMGVQVNMLLKDQSDKAVQAYPKHMWKF